MHAIVFSGTAGQKPAERKIKKKNAIRGEMAFFHALGSGQRKKERNYFLPSCQVKFNYAAGRPG
jgi:hypothetical protein